MSVGTEVRRFVLSDRFPPVLPLPPVAASDTPWLEQLAQGPPGACVWPGLFPRGSTKLARMLLAAAGHLEAGAVVAAASAAYAPDRGLYTTGRPRAERRYHAHDALACALVHPALPPALRHELATAGLSASSATRGARSRKKSWAVVRWAVRAGYLEAAQLPTAVAARLVPPRAYDEIPAAPHGAVGALAVFAARWPRFRHTLRRSRQDGSWLDYPGIAELGRHHFTAFRSGCRAPFVSAVFAAMEHVLTHGDGAAKNLVVVGLFEAVQGSAYHAGRDGDAYEAALLPRSRDAWANLIEGWTGAGIRDLKAWRAVPER